MTKNRLPEIVLLHCIGVLMILFGHFAQYFNYGMLGEILITGVPLFLFMSGYLVGFKPTPPDIKKWLKKKASRILVPYYIILISIFGIYLAFSSETFIPKQWLFLFTNLQGFTNYLFLNDLTGYYSPLDCGLGHFWFVSIIMLCYMVVVVVSKLYEHSYILQHHYKSIIFITLIILQPLLLYYNLQINYIVIFCLGWIAAKTRFEICNRSFLSLTTGMILFVGARFLGRRYLDDTLIYEKYLAILGSDARGIWLFYAVFYLRRQLPTIINKIASFRVLVFLESIIYEVFLIHHIIIKGAWSIFRFVDNPWYGVVIVLPLILILSVVVNKISNAISGLLLEQ